MKKYKVSKSEQLMIDVIDYAFTEWLVRRGLFSAFKENYVRVFSNRPFRDRLRSHIRRSLRGHFFGPSHLISSAFLFSSTPQGDKFWRKESEAWQRFCADFQLKL